MFDTVFIHTPSTENKDKNVNPEELRSLPFLYLVANNVWESDNVKISDRYGLIFGHGVHFDKYGFDKLLIGTRNTIPSGAVLFSPVDEIKKYNLKHHSIKSENSILLLAAAGMRIFLPNFTFDRNRVEEIFILKSKLSEERIEYLQKIAEIADEAFDRLSSGIYGETVDWALNEAFLKINISAENINTAFAKIDRSLLKKIGYDLFVEGIPCIVSSLEEKGFKGATSAAIASVLKALCGNLAKNIEERKYPEAVYGVKFRKKFQQ